MKHFLNTQDIDDKQLKALLGRADALRAGARSKALADKAIALVFFNPSLRTRTSFELGVRQLGGHAVVLQPGKDAWPMEIEMGAVMEGDAEEHVAEAVRVLSRYVDLIGVRAFPKFENWEEDRKDQTLRAFADYAGVPVINLETITHPCQELALARTMQDRLGELDKRRFVLTWSYHPKPLNTAVANSALTIATRVGMDVTLLCPNKDFVLDQRYMAWGEENAERSGGSLKVTHDIESAYQGAHFVYAKSWGALPYFGRWDAEKSVRDANRHFIVDSDKMAITDNGFFSHCLPMRRNLIASDEVIDSDYSCVIDEAENRLHVQKAVMEWLVNEEQSS